MMKLRTKTNEHQLSRSGATAVEFAMIAPILFLTLFACVEFGRIMLVQSYVEQAAFESARNIAVVGAAKSEAQTIANQEMSVLGITPTVTVKPMNHGIVQQEINELTDQISVTVEASSPGFFFPSAGKFEREAVVDTERFEY
jgi:Flp pilus assembly protein TadG